MPSFEKSRVRASLRCFVFLIKTQTILYMIYITDTAASIFITSKAKENVNKANSAHQTRTATDLLLSDGVLNSVLLCVCFPCALF